MFASIFLVRLRILFMKAFFFLFILLISAEVGLHSSYFFSVHSSYFLPVLKLVGNSGDWESWGGLAFGVDGGFCWWIGLNVVGSSGFLGLAPGITSRSVV